MSKTLDRIPGRRVLVTGTASGMCRATAHLLAREGALLALLDLPSAPLKPMAAKLKTRALQADVTDAEAVRQAVRSGAQQLGGLDGLINVAGIAGDQLLQESSLSNWHRILDVNLTGPMLVTQAARDHILQNYHAAIVNVVSGIGSMPLPGQGAYADSRAGLIAWSAAQELPPRIRGNVTCQRATDTPMLRSTLLPGASPESIGGHYACAIPARPTNRHRQSSIFPSLIPPSSPGRPRQSMADGHFTKADAR